MCFGEGTRQRLRARKPAPVDESRVDAEDKGMVTRSAAAVYKNQPRGSATLEEALDSRRMHARIRRVAEVLLRATQNEARNWWHWR